MVIWGEKLWPKWWESEDNEGTMDPKRWKRRWSLLNIFKPFVFSRLNLWQETNGRLDETIDCEEAKKTNNLTTWSFSKYYEIMEYVIVTLL